MPGSGAVLLDTQASAAATVALHALDKQMGGAFRRAYFAVETSAIGGGDTWTVTLSWGPGGATNTVQLANATVTATGIQEIVVESPFKDANRAIPAPTHVTYTLSVDGGTPDFAGTIQAWFGD